MRGLEAGRYRFAVPWPSDDWYLKSLTATAADKKPQPLRLPLSVSTGQRLNDITVTLRGRVAREKSDKRPFRVYLVPFAAEAADELLAYAEAEAALDGSFALSNLAPGKYWLLAQAVSEAALIAPLAYDAAQRAKLRHAAARAGKEIILTVCQRVADVQLSESAP